MTLFLRLFRFLLPFRRFQLVADGDTLTGSDELREIGIESMVGKTSKVTIL